MKIIITESQLRGLISEKRSHPELNKAETFSQFLTRVLSKSSIENIFASFRDKLHTTDVNKNNEYGTPTGFYSYPLSSYNIKPDMDEHSFRASFPYKNELEYLYFIVLNTRKGVLTSSTTKEELDSYVGEIKERYGWVHAVSNMCDSFLDGKFESRYVNQGVFHDTHLFWLFLYSVANSISPEKENSVLSRKSRMAKINILCREIGVNGFIDYEGHGYIHSAEPKQAVFFKIKNIAETYIYSGTKNVPKFTEDVSIIKRKNGDYNIIDKNNRLLSKEWFGYIYPFKDDIAFVLKNKKINIINKNGVLLSDIWFDDIKRLISSVFVVKNGSKYTLMDKNGKLLNDNWFSEIEGFRNGIARISLNNKYNFINVSGKLISDIWYDQAYITDTPGIFSVVKNGKNLYIDEKGVVIDKKP